MDMYVHKTHQSVFKRTKDPQKQQIALELPDCKRCTKVHIMHKSDHIAQKWITLQMFPP